MIHITKAKGGFMVVILGKKREVLSTSEILKTKQSAYENVFSQSNWFPCHDTDFPKKEIVVKLPVGVIVQDDTFENPKFFYLHLNVKKVVKQEISSMLASKLTGVKNLKKYEKKSPSKNKGNFKPKTTAIIN